MKKKKPQLDINKVRLRSDWGKVKPFTRVEEDKTKFNRKQKHKKEESEE